mmetsp:Transcript_19510/g.74867  ORF Transcript_19510/g.74867 Transcript_19510/m.74867 type:complete len:897 (-) Transcript_19510:142-2832(-)
MPALPASQAAPSLSLDAVHLLQRRSHFLVEALYELCPSRLSHVLLVAVEEAGEEVGQVRRGARELADHLADPRQLVVEHCLRVGLNRRQHAPGRELSLICLLGQQRGNAPVHDIALELRRQHLGREERQARHGDRGVDEQHHAHARRQEDGLKVTVRLRVVAGAVLLDGGQHATEGPRRVVDVALASNWLRKLEQDLHEVVHHGKNLARDEGREVRQQREDALANVHVVALHALVHNAQEVRLGHQRLNPLPQAQTHARDQVQRANCEVGIGQVAGRACAGHLDEVGIEDAQASGEHARGQSLESRAHGADDGGHATRQRALELVVVGNLEPPPHHRLQELDLVQLDVLGRCLDSPGASLCEGGDGIVEHQQRAVAVAGEGLLEGVDDPLDVAREVRARVLYHHRKRRAARLLHAPVAVEAAVQDALQRRHQVVVLRLRRDPPAVSAERPADDAPEQGLRVLEQTNEKLDEAWQVLLHGFSAALRNGAECEDACLEGIPGYVILHKLLNGREEDGQHCAVVRAGEKVHGEASEAPDVPIAGGAVVLAREELIILLVADARAEIARRVVLALLGRLVLPGDGELLLLRVDHVCEQDADQVRQEGVEVFEDVLAAELQVRLEHCHPELARLLGHVLVIVLGAKEAELEDLLEVGRDQLRARHLLCRGALRVLAVGARVGHSRTGLHEQSHRLDHCGLHDDARVAGEAEDHLQIGAETVRDGRRPVAKEAVHAGQRIAPAELGRSAAVGEELLNERVEEGAVARHVVLGDAAEHARAVLADLEERTQRALHDCLVAVGEQLHEALQQALPGVEALGAHYRRDDDARDVAHLRARVSHAAENLLLAKGEHLRLHRVVVPHEVLLHLHARLAPDRLLLLALELGEDQDHVVWEVLHLLRIL